MRNLIAAYSHEAVRSTMRQKGEGARNIIAAPTTRRQLRGWKKTPSKLIIALYLGYTIIVNFWYHTHDEAEMPPMIERQRPTMAPRNSSLDTIGFIHIGKTGGSSISNLLRNGCNSFQSGPCRIVANETIVSKLVEHYYHVPDFWRLPTSNHRVYIISVRDVYDRTVSALLYHHPENVKYYNMTETRKQKYLGPLAYKCFPTLETFSSLMMRGNSTMCNYPYRHNVVEDSNCSELACAVIHGKVRFFTHLFFNYRNILNTKIPTTEPKRQLYAIRQEHLWDDWSKINSIFVGQRNDATDEQTPVIIPSGELSNQRNITGLKLPVTREISDQGRTKLCKALESEYVAYFQILQRAENINASDLEDSRKIASRNCPHLDTRSMLT